MRDDMEEIFQTSQGLKYSMDREIWGKIFDYSQFHHGRFGTTALELLEWDITALDLFPSFLCFLAFVIDSFSHPERVVVLKYVVFLCACWYVCGTLLVRFFDTAAIWLGNIFIWIYFILTKYNIDLIIIILISIFVLHKWYIALIFVSEKFVLHTIYCFTYGSYAALKPIHDRIGKSILQWTQE